MNLTERRKRLQELKEQEKNSNNSTATSTTTGSTIYSSDRAKRLAEMKQAEQQERLSAVSSELTSRIDTWFKNNENFVSNYNYRFKGFTGSYNDPYDSTINDWISSIAPQKSNFDKEAASIRAIIEENKDYLNPDYVKSVFSALDSASKVQNDILNNASEHAKYWSQWENKDSYLEWQQYRKEIDPILNADDFDEYFAAGEAKGVKENWRSDVENNIAYLRNPEILELYESSAKSANGGSFGTVENVLLNKINYKAAKYMTDEEYKVYNYYVGKGESEKAESYLKSLEETLTRRQAGELVSEIKGKPLKEAYFALESGADQFWSGVGNIDNLIMGTEGDLPSATQMASPEIREGIKGGWGVAYDLAQTTANMLPSILVGTVTGGAGGAITLGASATGNAYSQMMELGYDKGQARTYAALVGASETALSYALGGISKLGGKVSGNVISMLVSKVDNAIARVAIDIGGNMLSEGLEEAIQEVLDPIFKMAATGEDFEGIDLEQVLYSGLLGALSAGFLEGVPTIAGTALNSSATNEIYGKNVEGIVAKSIEIDSENAHAQRMQAKLDAGKSVSGYQINRLLEANDVAMRAQDVSAIRESVTNRLTELGETGNISAITDAIVKLRTGEKLSKAERQTIENSKSGQRVVNESDPENMRSGMYSSSWAEKVGTDRAAAYESYLNALKGIETEESSATVSETEKAENAADSQQVTGKLPASKTEFATDTNVGDKVAQEPAVASEGVAEVRETKGATYEASEVKDAQTGEIEASEGGKATVKVDGKDVGVKVKEIASVSGGAITVRLDNGETVNANEIDFGNEDTALVYQAAADMSTRVGGFNADTVRVFVNGFDPSAGLNAAEYVQGFLDAYRYGAEGAPISELAKDRYASKMTEEQRNRAFHFGRAFGNEKVEQAQAKLDEKKERGLKKRSENAKIDSKTTKEGDGAMADKESASYYDGDRNALTERQSASIEFLEKVFGRRGVKITFIDSYIDESGRRVYKNAEGRVLPAPNGYYNPADGSITIDINAGEGGEGLILNTTSHELTHFIKDWSPKKFRSFAEFLYEVYGESGIPLEAFIQDKIAKAKKKDRTLSRELALEEFVADSCEMMLVDIINNKNQENLQKLIAKDKTLFEKIKEFFVDLLERIKAAYEGVNPQTLEGSYIREMRDVADKLQTMWTEALLDAVDTYSAVTETNAATSEDTKLSDRDSNENELSEEQQAYFKNSKVRDAEGRLLKVYHGTPNAEFTVFDKNRVGKGNDQYGAGFYFATDKVASSHYGSRVIESYLNIKKPIKVKNGVPNLIEANIRLTSKQAYEVVKRLPDIYDSEESPLGDYFDSYWEVGAEDWMIRELAEQYREVGYLDSDLFRHYPNELHEALRDVVGYDGVEVSFDSGEKFYVAWFDNQMKLTSNLNPTTDPDIRYSDRDSDGNTLTEGQLEYFKDSKVRNEKGELLVMYHGTPNAGFTKFKSGTYFTQHKWYADRYQSPGASSLSYKKSADSPDTYAVYLNIKKPFDTRNQTEKDIFYNEYYRQWGTGTDLMESGLPDWLDGMDLQEFIEEMGYDYDGLILDEGGTGGYGEEVVSRGVSYVIFDAAQAKNIDNENPTDDPDIRYSERYEDYNKPITIEDIDVIRSIGSKSINKFTSEDIEKAQKWAYKFYQELGVKSPFFRAWFGDWRAKDKGQIKIVSVPTIDIYQASLVNGNYVIKDTGWNVYAGKTLNDDTRHHSGGNRINVKSLNAIEAILDNAVLLDTIVSEKDTKKKSENTAFLHKLYTIIQYNNRQYIAKTTVEEYYNETIDDVSRRAYNLKAIKIEPVGGQIGDNSSSSIPDTSSIISISDLYKFVNSFDKDFSPAREVSEHVLNKDGTPKVFYHGTNAEFTAFDLTKSGKNFGAVAEGMFFFIDKKQAYPNSAKDYARHVTATNGGKETIYECYIKMQNPLVVDSSRSYDPISHYDRNSGRIYERYFDGNYDGIIVKDITKKNSDSVLALVDNSTQIKSAIDNIGTFDGNNADIRYSDRDDFYGLKRDLKEKYGVDTDAVLQMADSYLQNYGGALNKTQFRMQFLDLMHEAVKFMNDTSSEGIGRVNDMVIETATEIVNNPAIGGELVTELRRIKRHIRDTKIKIPSGRKGDFDVFGGFEAFRRKHWGRLTLTNDGIDVDTIYPEFQELFGKSWFPDNIDTVPDQLMRIAEVADASLADYSENYYDSDEVMIDVAGEIFDKVQTIAQSASENTARINYRRAEESLSPRAMLAGALEGVAQNDIEKNKLKAYKEKIGKINAEEQKLQGLRREIKELSFATGPRDTARIEALREEAAKTANRIGIYDKQLLELEASKPLRDVLERERRNAYKRAEAEGREALAKYRERAAKTQEELKRRYQESKKRGTENRRKTEIRNKIKRTVGELNDLLLHGSKNRNVKSGLQEAVAAALEAINMDTVAADERIAKYNALIAKATDEDVIASLTKTRDNIRRQGDALGDKLEAMRKAYRDIREKDANSEYPDYFKAEAQLIENRIESVIDKVGNTPLRNMSYAQLDAVYDMYKMVLATVRNANAVFKEGKIEDLQKNVGAVMNELSAIPKLPEERSAVGDNLRGYVWNELTPYYAFSRIGSKTFESFYWEAIKGQDVWARDIDEARDVATEAREKYHYDAWDFDKIHKFKLADGREFSVSLKHMMSIYAYAKRPQAAEHMRKGGFFFNDKETFRKKGGVLTMIRDSEASFKIDDVSLAAIISAMTEEQRRYVDDMQTYLTQMGEKGNEVTRVLWGIDLFKEKVYFPLKSSRDFVYQANQPVQESSLKNDGMTKETKPGASNPIVLEAFDDVWATHVNRMSQYHAYVLPIENLNKVLNYGTWTNTDAVAVSTMLRSRYGSAANDYLNQFIGDLNGVRNSQGATAAFFGMFTKFKKTAVAGSLSVVIQQPTAILRAQAEIDAKYFVGKPNMEKLSEKWEEIKKYAPIAIIKDMGGFDAGAGRQTTEWLNADTQRGLKKVSSKIDDFTMMGAAWGDQLGWSAIWEAVKRETLAKNPKLVPTSEEFLKLVGERFTEVIVKTQVYDSTLSRSGYMRSKNELTKMMTTFMGEPTVSANMLYDSALQAKRGSISKGTAVRRIGAVYLATVTAALAKSVIYALRDDDDDESYAEKYMQALGGAILNDINPLAWLPGVRDVLSIFDGWEVERTDMALVQDLKNAIDGLDSENKSTWRKIEDFAGAVAGFLGLPLKNVMRTLREVYNGFENMLDGVSGGKLGGAFLEGVTGKDAGKSKSLYDAIMSGDDARLEIYREDYKSEDAYNTALSKALRENDERIAAAAEARYNGEIAEYMRIAKEIIGEGNFSQDNVVAAINAKMAALKKAEETGTEEQTEEDKVESIYKVDDFFKAVRGGDIATAYAVREDLVNVAIENGEDREDAEKAFESKLVTYVSDQYEEALIGDGEAKSMLTRYGGMTEAKAASRVRYWAFKLENPEYEDLYEGAVNKYYDGYYKDGELYGKSAKSYGITLDVYAEYVRETSGLSKKEDIMYIINTLPLSKEQKDALYYLNGWAKSTIREAPWK